MVVIIILSILVLLHELGHFFVARWLKIQVDEFGLGFPPKAIKLFKWLGTDFTLNWVPFGGFVKLHGEFSSPAETLYEQSFHIRSAWHQIMVMLGGPVANLLIAILIFAGVYSIGGIPVSLNQQPRIAQITPGSPAAIAGLKPGTNLISFKNTSPNSAQTVEIRTINEAQKFVADHRGETWIAVSSGPCSGQTCASEQSQTQLYFRTPTETPAGQGAMGVVFSEYEVKFYPWYEMPFRGMWFGLGQTYDLTRLMLGELGKLVTQLVTGHGLSQAVAGPIGIVSQAEKAGLSQAGALVIFNFMGMLSLNLAVMNLLPIPALDGGRIVVVLIGYLIGRQRVAKFENYIHYGGFIFIVGLLILISFRDVWNIWLQR
jgi:regulator of sigma E protease